MVEVGDAVGSLAPGDLVSVPFQISCGECERCRRGQTGNCESVDFLSTYGLPLGPDYGGFVSDLSASPTPRRCWSPVPDGIEPAAVASLSDNIPDAWRTVGPQLEAEPGAAVLICGGAGSIPLYAAALALAAGAERVDFAGGRPWERELAAELGAEPARRGVPEAARALPDHGRRAAPATRGSPARCARPSPTGICTSIGIYFEPETPVPLLEMYTKGIRFHTGRVHARPAIEPILELVRSGAFEPELVTRETATWDDAAEAVAGHGGKLVISRALSAGPLSSRGSRARAPRRATLRWPLKPPVADARCPRRRTSRGASSRGAAAS